MTIKSNNPAYSFDNAFCHGPGAKGFKVGDKLVLVNIDGEEVAFYNDDLAGRSQCREDVISYQLDPIRVIAITLEEEIKNMQRGNTFIGDAPDNMKLARHNVNVVLQMFGYNDLMIKRDEKFRFRNDLANRIYSIYEAL